MNAIDTRDRKQRTRNLIDNTLEDVWFSGRPQYIGTYEIGRNECNEIVIRTGGDRLFRGSREGAAEWLRGRMEDAA